MASPAARRIESGYQHAVGTTGGYASELWEVVGVDPMFANGPLGVSAGLPGNLQPHPADPNLIVRERTVQQIIDVQTTLVRVDYRPASFDIGPLYGAVSFQSEPMRLRLIWSRITQDGIQGWVLRGGKGDEQSVITLPTTTRKFTVYAGGDQDYIDYLIEVNKGKLYTLGSSPYDRFYVLTGGTTRKQKDGRVTAEYVFTTHQGFAAIPANTYPGQTVAIPACPPCGMIYTNLATPISSPEFSTRRADQLYAKGKELTGL